MDLQIHMSMSLVDNNTLNLSLSKKEMMIFNKISRRLSLIPWQIE